MTPCPRCGGPVAAGKNPSPLCERCASRQADPAPEFDHRGIQLPARTRVGGIIIPQ